MTYVICQKRGNKKAVAVSTFYSERHYKCDCKEAMYRALWLLGIPPTSYKKYCYKPLEETAS